MIVAIVVAAMLMVPAIVFMVECLFGLICLQSAPVGDAPPFAVLMPAHDEARGIQATIGAVVGQLRPGDRLLVVADNCADDTARLARDAGAEVAERSDPARRGKGYALAFGRGALEADLPPVVIVMDADCRAAPGSLTTLAAEAFERNAAVQGLYLFDSESRSAPLVAISNFAFLVKNMIRQRGLARMGAPALLQGTGMAFPRAIFASAPLAGDDIVEDLSLGITLLRQGHDVRWTETSRFTSFAASQAATVSQRKRWEHGFLSSAVTGFPKLLVAAVKRRHLALVLIALDLLVPPLSLFVTVLILAWSGFAVLAVVTGAFAPLLIVSAALAFVVAGVLLAWAAEGRRALPFRTLLKAPFYMIWKAPIYGSLFLRKQKEWVRTARD